ncbi:MAG: hypothetical protein HUJ26_24130 [Planctomycetaceae bacterium]|nr:hypothetical protein [Planctomycetaceae bacterium]
MIARFVILTHDHPHLHWDLMLEDETSLLTWRLSEEPNRTGSIPAEALPPHRKHYLDYEGPVSGNRGSVTRWDAGTYEVTHQSEYELSIVLNGEKLHGPATLSQLDSNGKWKLQLSTEDSSDS